MKTLVVGGTQDFGKAITDYFDAYGIGRSNGFDIDHSEKRTEIVNLSLEYDLVVIVTNGGNCQSILTEEMAIKWLEDNHDGYLMCLGSTAIYHDTYKRPTNFWKYIREKEGLKALTRYVTKKVADHRTSMRFTNLQVGRLDNEKARKRENFRVGLQSQYICELINFLYNSPKDLNVHELFVDPKY